MPQMAMGGGAQPTAVRKIGGGSGIGGSSNTGNAKLEEQIQELKLHNDTLDKEREFYFSKLRDIELLLQAREIEKSDNVVGQDILKILYASEIEKVTIGPNGALTIESPNGDVMKGGDD